MKRARTQDKLDELLLPLDKDLAKEPRPQIRLFKGQVILNPTISKTNFACFLLHSLVIGGIMVPVGLMVLPLLTNLYGLNNDERLNVVAINQAIALVLKFLIAPWIGSLIDRYGRRAFIIAACAMQYAGVAVTPNLPSVDPYYYLLSILTDVGLSILLSVPLLADYVDYETKGRVAGISAIISYVSSFTATEIASSWNLEVGLASRYHYIALAGVVLSCIFIPGLKGGQYHKELYIDQKAIEAKRKAAESICQENIEQFEHEHLHTEGASNFTQDINTNEEPFIDPEEVRQEDRDDLIIASRRMTALTVQSLVAEEPIEDLKPGFRAAVREAQRNPWILLGFITSFMGTAYFLLIQTLFTNYITIMVGSEQAATEAYQLNAIHLLTALFCCIFYGFGADKFQKFKIISFVIIDSAVAIVMFILMPSPHSAIAYIGAVLYGMGSSGYMTFNLQVISKYPNPKYRASVMAVASMCATLGTALINILGTLLSKSNPLIPFYLYLGMCAVGFVAILIIYHFKKQILNRI